MRVAGKKKEKKKEKKEKEPALPASDAEQPELLAGAQPGMLGFLKGFFNRFLNDLFGGQKHVKIGLYGPPNGGKTTIANRICMDWLGEEMGSVSPIPHETREVQTKDQIMIKRGKKQLSFSLVDTPGIATKIDYEEFIRSGLAPGVAKKRAKEATKGVIDAIKWLADMDSVTVVLDASKEP